MKYKALHFILILLGMWVLAGRGFSTIGCTSAVVDASATRNGKMILWKHRDTGHPDNFVERIEATDSSMAYVALFNAEDREKREAWVGFNSAGFAIMNTASYNLAPDTAVVKDREGFLMTMALQCCRTMTDFTELLDSLVATGQPLGVQANFGIVDAQGNGGYIEASDHAYIVFPLAQEPSGCLIRSNYSFTGGHKKRLGAVRYDDACHLSSATLQRRDITPELFVDTLSRSFYHAGRKRDDLLYAKDNNISFLPDKGEYIPRRSSSASVAIEVPLLTEQATHETGNTSCEPRMLITIGCPAVAPVSEVTLTRLPEPLRPSPATGRSPLCDRMKALRNSIFIKSPNSSGYRICIPTLLQYYPQ